MAVGEAGATLEPAAGRDGEFRLRGTLDFAAVPALLECGRRLFPAAGTVRLDLGGLETVNSAGLALLLEWQRQLAAGGRRLELINVPRALVNIARVSELETVLSLS
jgi:phospholipid transport system transporter-binding protein